MKTKYVSLEEILRLHFQLIEDFGGSHGVRDEDRLKSLEYAPKQIVFEEEQYTTIYDKAAVYLRNITDDHPFIDGNKRTVLTVCAIFLNRNGHTVNTDPKTLEDFTLTIATEHPTIDEISAWLKEHCQHE